MSTIYVCKWYIKEDIYHEKRTEKFFSKLLMQRRKLSVPSTAQMSTSHVYIEGHVRAARVSLHDHAVVRYGDRQRSLVGVIVSLVHGGSGVRGATYDAYGCSSVVAWF